MIFLNDNNRYAAKWLRNLVERGDLPRDAEVCDRDVCDIQPGDVEPFTQVHLFAGIGGWVRALDIAGWPADKQVWTMSLPCQPFSHAGRRKGSKDERHLWPVARKLVNAHRPEIIFGEQVGSYLGRKWMREVKRDLAGLGYSVAVIGMPAAVLGAPHLRGRLWWVASRAHWGKQPESRIAYQPYWMWDDWIEQKPTRWALCHDRVLRPYEQGCFPARHWDGEDGWRNGLIEGYGNAIVPDLGAEFIKMWMTREWHMRDLFEDRSAEFTDEVEGAFCKFFRRVEHSNPLVSLAMARLEGILYVKALPRLGQLRHWPTVVKSDGGTPYVSKGFTLALRTQALNLREEDARSDIWGTPTARAWKGWKHVFDDTKGILDRQIVKAQDLKQPLTAKQAIDIIHQIDQGKRRPLNPEFCRWLMGYPPEWTAAAPTLKESKR